MATQDRLPTSINAGTWTGAYTTIDDPVGSPDDDTTYMYKADASGTCKIGFAVFSITPTSINKVTQYFRSRLTSGALTIAAKLYISGGAAGGYSGTNEAQSTSYANFSYDWLTNPKTGVAWTEADVEGTGSNYITDMAIVSGGTDAGEEARVTQTYLRVDYNVASGTIRRRTLGPRIGSRSS